MPFNERLVERIRGILEPHGGITEKRMFGGVAFLLRGNMCCGVTGDDLIVRVGPAAYGEALRRAHVRPMDFTGRPLTGFVYVRPKGCARRATLERCVGRGVDFARSLPGK